MVAAERLQDHQRTTVGLYLVMSCDWTLRRNRVAHLQAQLNPPLDVGSLGTHVIVDGKTVDEFHDQLRTVAQRAAIVDGDDSRIFEAGDEFDFSKKPVAVSFGRQGTVQQDLDRHHPIRRSLSGLEHPTLAAVVELLQYFIPLERPAKKLGGGVLVQFPRRGVFLFGRRTVRCDGRHFHGPKHTKPVAQFRHEVLMGLFRGCVAYGLFGISRRGKFVNDGFNLPT